MAGHKAAIQLIREADRGQLLDDLQRGVDDIVEAIEAAHGQGTGEVTIKLKIRSEAEGAYKISAALAVKVPQPKRLDTLMFLDADSGDLVRRDPRQPELPAVVDADFRNRRGSADTEE